MTDRREMQAALAWWSLPRVGEKTLQALMDHAREARSSLAGLWEASHADLAPIVPLAAPTLAALASSADVLWERAGTDADAVRSRGVELLCPGDPDSPPALRDAHQRNGRRWPLLFAYGALGLLEEPRVALVSSRGVSGSGLSATDALADALARRDVVLVTSPNREAYQITATAAKRQAGPAVLILDRGVADAFPGGLEREPVAPARVWDTAFDPDLQLLLSPFGWRHHWTARNGKRRDALLFDLADAVVAIDVQPDGTMDQECRRAVRSGRPVFALDRGADTEPGTRRLWEECPDIRRLPWSGGDDAAQAVVNSLPRRAAALTADRALEGWIREVALFLGRLGKASGPARGALVVYPSTGALASATAGWHRPEAKATRGAAILLADLWSTGPGSPSRISQLLPRVAQDGLLAALVPAGWLLDAEHAATRNAWLQTAALELSVQLPSFPVTLAARPAEPAALLVLRRGAAVTARPLTFVPDRAVMGRFHLRCYLRTILAAVTDGGTKLSPPQITIR